LAAINNLKKGENIYCGYLLVSKGLCSTEKELSRRSHNMTFEVKDFNRHIRNAREAARGLTGLERAYAITDYFDKHTIHPHPEFTLDEHLMGHGRQQLSDKMWVYHMMEDMAALTASNEYLRRL
jgi:NAD(P)H-nitrite reductase large subunit